MSNTNKKRDRGEYEPSSKQLGASKALVVGDPQQRVGKKTILPPPPPSQVLSTPKSLFKAKIKNPLSFEHDAFNDKKIDSGQGLKWHQFSNISFPPNKEEPEDTKKQLSKYIGVTGLEPIKTKQDWGLGSSMMYRSRRGSIGGFSELEDGGIKGWRLHSLPTSEALNEGASSEKEFLQHFESRAEIMTKPPVNSKNTPQSVNTILSDVGKVGFDKNAGQFQFNESTFAMGISGKGLDNKLSNTPKDLYLPSIEVALDDGKKGTPSQTYHSEPLSLTLHNQYRKIKMEKDSNLVGMFASFPNQVCFQCGRMFKKKTGDNSVISGVPGVKFGGQHPGDTFSEKRQNTIIRATPMEDLMESHANKLELRNLFTYHKK